MKLFIIAWLWITWAGAAHANVIRAEAPEYEPPSCETLNALWPTYHAHFKLRFERLERFDCPSETSKLAETFHLIQNVRFTPNRHAYVPEFYNWFGRVLKNVYYEVEGPAPAQAHSPKTGDVKIHQSFFNYPLYHRAAMLVHEARHVELGGGHATCKRGESKGTEACDERFSLDWSSGAYSHGFTTMLWLAKFSNYPAAERPAILRLLDWEIANRFNGLTDERISWIRENYLR